MKNNHEIAKITQGVIWWISNRCGLYSERNFNCYCLIKMLEEKHNFLISNSFFIYSIHKILVSGILFFHSTKIPRKWLQPVQRQSHVLWFRNDIACYGIVYGKQNPKYLLIKKKMRQKINEVFFKISIFNKFNLEIVAEV